MSSQDQLKTVELFARELGRALEPLVKAARGGPEGVKTFFENAGFDEAFAEGEADKVAAFLGNHVSEPATVLDKTVLSEDPSIGDVDEVVEAIASIYEGIKKLDDIQVSHPDVDQLGLLLLDHLLVTYLDEHHRTIHNVLALFGVIVESDGPGAGDFDFSGLETVLKHPSKLPKKVFNWANEQEDFLGAVVLYYLKGVCWQIGFPASIEAATTEHVEAITGVSDIAELAVSGPGDLDPQLKVPILAYTDQGTRMVLGIKLVPLPGKDDRLPGLAVVPFGKAGTDQEWDLGKGWTFNVEASGSIGSQGVGVQPTTQGGLETKLVDLESGSPPGELHAEAGVSFDGATDEKSATTLLGDPEASRLAVKNVSVTGSGDYADGDVGFGLELPASGTIGVHPSDFGGFLGKVMPEDGVFYDFDAVAGWDSDSGLYFERGGTLEVAIPQRGSLGPVTMKEIYLAATPPSGGGDGGSGGGGGRGTSTTTGTITIAGAASADVTLGPVTATVKRMGVDADVSFPEDKDGNLGPVDMEVGFKPPDGAGISIDAGPVTGGGYLEFDPEKERYAGVLQLKTSKLTINAVGLLTTELPGGEDGFSLLLIISGEFPPVQLGMGFTLNGVGGLIGVNRSVKSKPLGKAVRTGSMGSILFPENPVANSQRIISDLRSVFPPTDGVHVVGPMAKLGYGGGSMITIDVGVILSIPTWKIVLLGKMSTALPNDKKALIELNLAVAGVLDIPNKRVAIDASLYDSRIVMFTVTGDMALRSRWGTDPRFVMSVGGWNPRFDPPSNFPKLDRVKASMGKKGDNFRAELSGYLAVTSNTFQVGASVFAKAQAGPLVAKGTLAFDALFEFDPFKFVIDFLAKFSVTFKGKGLSVSIDGTFMGPGPFRIKATVSLSLLMIKIKKQINATIGPSKSSEGMPTSRILPKLTEELGRPVNWQAQLPSDGPQLVTLRDVETGDDEVLAHPMGEIGVRQTVVPLGYEIEKFGKATPAGYSTFTIEGVSVGGSDAVALGAETVEQFAPAKYRKMSDAEKLDSPAFESHAAGRKMRHEGVYCGYPDGERARNSRASTIEYECTVIDRPRGNWGTALSELGRFRTAGLDATSGLPAGVARSLMDVGAAARSPDRAGGLGRFELSESEKATFDAQAAGEPNTVDATVTAADDAAADGGTQTRVVRGGPDPDVGGLAGSLSVDDVTYTVARATDLREVDVPTADEGMSRSQAERALADLRERRPGAAEGLRVVESHRVSGRAEPPAGGENA